MKNKILSPRRLVLIATLFLLPLQAGPPDGYYDGTEGLIETALQTALHDIIDGHTVLSYSSLWTHVQTTDDKSNGKVWDMYSDVPGGTPPYEFTFVSDQCGNYGGEGDCYNREHSWPKSWFDDDPPMNTDLFHIYPTDGYVNGRRGNYPYGEVGTTTWISQNSSKVGTCTYPGYSGTVFEPIDDYKGDFARTYFYMSVRYYNEDNGWPGSPMVDGAQLEDWALAMLMDWHQQDPVSQKEIDRNEAVYAVQGNRNPFIDHAWFVDNIWGDPVETTVESNYDQPPGLAISPAYPNPFNPRTVFNISVEGPQSLTITIIDISGREVYSYGKTDLTVGEHRFSWGGVNGNNQPVAGGIYFISAETGATRAVRKLVLLR